MRAHQIKIYKGDKPRRHSCESWTSEAVSLKISTWLQALTHSMREAAADLPQVTDITFQSNMTAQSGSDKRCEKTLRVKKAKLLQKQFNCNVTDKDDDLPHVRLPSTEDNWNRNRRCSNQDLQGRQGRRHGTWLDFRSW